MSSLTKAHFLSDAGLKTPIFMRFSTVTYGREYPDAARNPRGFAIKFYTGEGNYDIVGLNFVCSAIVHLESRLTFSARLFLPGSDPGPDVIRSQSRSPKIFLLDYNSLFDLLAMTPEANHAGLMFFSDHGTPDGWRNQHGYGCHTFKWVNKEGKFVYIKYHFLADHGQKQLSLPEATRIAGEDPDYSKRELWDAIEAGEDITWTAHVQIMEPEEADPAKLGFDPFDVTKMHEFGKLHLNKNPENFHRDSEQSAFSPGSMVPGIEDSPDPLLQFRMFFYRDAQYHRIGVNLHQIPVNCHFMAGSLSSLNFDGAMRTDANHAMNPQYAPNSFVNKFRPDVAEAPYKVADNTVSRKSHYFHEGKISEYDQPRDLYSRVMDAQAREHLHSNTAAWLKKVTVPEIQSKYLAQVYRIAPEYARSVYDLLPESKFEFSDVEELSKGAETAGKERKFRPSSDADRLVGYPAAGIYNV